MPHDANGNLLKVGDRVLIPGKITDIQPVENYCNCTVVLDHPMPPYDHEQAISSINTKQVVLAPVQEKASAA